MRAADYDPRADHDRDLFAILSVPWNAGEAEVKAGWRMATRAKHPDTGGSHEEFLEVQYAWEVLCEPTCRSMYVRAYLTRHPGQEQEQGGRSETGERSRTNEGRPRSGGQRTCTGMNTDGSLCTRTPMPGSERCTMHHSQSDEEIERILRRYTRTFYCKGTTREGLPCGNIASKDSDFCWLHGGSTASSGGSGSGPRQRSKCPGGPRGGLCIHTCLVGAEACWDHATEAQRQAAVRRVEPGRCAAVTQRGVPCSQKRWSDFPLCHSHVTGGLLEESLGRHRRSSGPPPPPPPPPPRPSAPRPQRSHDDAAVGGHPIVVCSSCGRRNRLRDTKTEQRCGSCQVILPGPGSPPPPPSGGPGAGPVPGRIATLEGVGLGRSRPFTIPAGVRLWRVSWSCGPRAIYPFMMVERSGQFVGLGMIGGADLQSGYSHFSDTGEFYLDCHIDDWWKAEIDVIE